MATGFVLYVHVTPPHPEDQGYTVLWCGANNVVREGEIPGRPYGAEGHCHDSRQRVRFDAPISEFLKRCGQCRDRHQEVLLARPGTTFKKMLGEPWTDYWKDKFVVANDNGSWPR
jgi:hypothetical protein